LKFYFLNTALYSVGRLDIFGKLNGINWNVLKCGPGEAWRRSVEVIV